MELVIATKNKGKLKEIIRLFEDTGHKLYSLSHFTEFPDVIEDGNTFEENAVKKALLTAQHLGHPVLADDSGLCVDALEGRPGVVSARFAGDGATDSENNAKLLEELQNIPPAKRSASFQCVIALCTPEGFCKTFSGKLSGFILDVPQGCQGFGYDPLFFLPEYQKTLAELSLDLKNKISHRGKALAEVKAYLESKIQV
jgi:XTP/dITP diphosphohydrolase